MSKRQNMQSLQEILADVFGENPQLKKKILEIRVIRGWKELLGKGVEEYTDNIFMKNGLLYVFLSSAVLRNDLLMRKEQIIIDLNSFAKEEILKDIIFR